MDPLSEIVSLLKPRSLMFGGIDAGGSWSFGNAGYAGIKCYAIVSGRCWLRVDGIVEPIRIETGDCFLLPHERGFCLASDPELPPVDLKTIVTAPLAGRIITHNGGGDCVGLGGYFVLEGGHAEMLLSILPPVVHIREQTDRAELRTSFERMMQELREPKPGGSLVLEHLASIVLVHALRLHLADRPPGGVGWLFALADPDMRTAIDLMHAAPARRWSLDELARRVGMSRSNFALKFKQRVGMSPMDYLARWRMLLAGDRLMSSDDSVSAIAALLGYESESAFSAAFKRIMHCSPRQYSAGQRSASA